MNEKQKKETPESEIVVLTGAGMSAESGIRTFRASDGLWEDYPIAEVATPEGFARNPELVLRFYNDRRRQLNEVTPNQGHHDLSLLMKKLSVTLISQNVDDLHQRAGSNCISMHGQLRSALCNLCHTRSPWSEDIKIDSQCPACGAKGKLRPDIVWFGEMPYYLEKIGEALAKCRIFVAIGTSGTVYPAAGFVDQLPSDCRTIEIGPIETEISKLFQEHIRLPASSGVKKLAQLLKADL